MTITLAGRYEPRELVAEGPLGALYRGRARGDAGFSRRVAIRSIATGVAGDPRFIEAWTAVAREVGRIGSSEVEQVLDVIARPDGAHVISEWIEGASLSRLLADRAERGAPFSWPMALELCLPLLEALEGPHARPTPVIHGALTPSAVRIGLDGRVKLTRFGIAAGLAAVGFDHGRRAALGLAHAAPELARGEDGDARTDQYAVGALLFTLLAGEAPPTATSTSQDDLPDLAALRADVPPLLAACVERALRSDPGERFASVDAFAAALAGLARSHPGPPQLKSAIRAVPLPERTTIEPRVNAPRGLPVAATVMVDSTELTEISAEAGRARTRPYQFDLKRQRRPDEEPVEPPPLRSSGRDLADDDSEAAPVPLTTLSGARRRMSPPLGLAPQATEMLDDEELRRMTLEPSRPLGLTASRTEYLADGELDQLRIDED